MDEEEIERAELYKLFATLFSREPSDEIIYQFRDMFQMRFTEPPQVIRMEFLSLFSDHQLSPHESLYNYPPHELPRLWGKATEEVEAFYNSVGLTIDEEISLIPDHISAELFFMSYLVENKLLKEQKLFMEKHLLQWVPAYCEELEKHASTTFFREVAILLKEFIITDYEENLKDYA
ncbi:MAG: molecular chaperone [Thermodesulfovibrionales bacterium]